MQGQQINHARIEQPNEQSDDGPWDVVIHPSSDWSSLLFFREVWEYRELLYFLIWRNIKVRYKQTIIGGLWVILQPVIPVLIFSVFFGFLAKIPSDNIPYPVFTYAALLPWQLFIYAFYAASQSLVNNQSLLTKIYFPRLLFPLSVTLDGVVDFVIASSVLFVMMYFYQIYLTWTVLVLPLLLLLTLLTALAMGLWAAALNVQYRDVSHIVTFLTQFLMFATPIFYPASLVPDRWRLLYGLNPMVGVVEGFRWALLRHSSPPLALLGVSLIVVLMMFIGGLYYFRRTEDTFADVV